MIPHDDASLLREFAARDSQAAFTELVQRHLDLVYSAALRQVNGDSGLAADVSQAVFTDLGRKARSLPPNVVLPAWLHRATRLAALAALRAQARRAIREREAVQMHELEQGAAGADWGSLRPVIDEALDQLNEKDREAVLRRYFQKQSFVEMSAALSVSEDAARMRVERALDKLRDLLAKRGVTSTGAALAAVLAAQSVSAAPTGLAVVIAQSSAAALAPATLATVLTFMTTMPIKCGLTAVAVASMITWTTHEHLRNRRLTSELGRLRAQEDLPPAPGAGPTVDPAEINRLRAEHQELLRLRGEVATLRRPQASTPPPPPVPRPGTGPEEAPTDAIKEAAKTAMMARLDYAGGWAAAFYEYASKNGGLMPASLADAQKYYPARLASAMSAFDAAKFELLYRGVLNDAPDPARTVIMREKEPFWNPDKPAWTRTYVFADGHTELHHSPDGNYTEWEGRLVIQPGGQKAQP